MEHGAHREDHTGGLAALGAEVVLIAFPCLAGPIRAVLEGVVAAGEAVAQQIVVAAEHPIAAEAVHEQRLAHK